MTYSVLLNDQPHRMIHPQRGLRQGDPLSPFLFVLCTEGLTHLLAQAAGAGHITGLKFGEHGPSVHQLLFADDCLFCCKAEEIQTETLMGILSRYDAVTGQVLNPEKSSIIFGKTISVENKTKVKQKTRIEAEGGDAKYLGLLESISGSKVKVFSYLKEKLGKQISSWHAKTLSQGGKEVLIKAVASALPVTAMSVFKLPTTLLGNLASAIASFWWSNVEHKRKIHWISWDKMCLPKELGGMRFRDLESFNQALLAKQAWRLIHFEDCLMSRVLKSKYFEDTDFINAVPGSRSSYAWKSLLEGRRLLQEGIKPQVGNGESLHVWTDPWLEDEDGICRPLLRRQRYFNVNLKVAELIDFQTRRWSRRCLQEFFVPSDIRILVRNQPIVSQADTWIWRYTRNMVYSVKTGYQLAFSKNNQSLIANQITRPSLNPLRAKIWKQLAPSKLKVFMWKALSGALPVTDGLRNRGMHCDQMCQRCGDDGESINHVLFSCTFARLVWAISGFPHPCDGFDGQSIFYQHELFDFDLVCKQRIE